jgi:hypothetical protein
MEFSKHIRQIHMPLTPTYLKLIHHLVRPARGGAAGVVIVFALLLFVAGKAGLIGIPLALLVVSWFFKYAYILFDHTVRGFDEPPTLDIQMVNPVDEQRPLAQLVILGLIYAAVKLLQGYSGSAASIAAAVVFAFFLPASVAVLGLESNLLKAAYPLEWMRIVRGLGVLYGAVFLIIALYVLVLGLLDRLDFWTPLEIAACMFAVLSVFSLLGGMLYERRDELGLETWTSPEQGEAKQRKQDLRQDEKIVLEAYGLMRAGSHTKSWQMLIDWLKSRGNGPEDYRWLCERVATWDDSRYITRLTQEQVERLLTLKRTGEALDVVVKRLERDSGFRPKSAANTLDIAQLAARGGGVPRVARVLLSDFAARFAGDPRVAEAKTLAHQLSA